MIHALRNSAGEARMVVEVRGAGVEVEVAVEIDKAELSQL